MADQEKDLNKNKDETGARTEEAAVNEGHTQEAECPEETPQEEEVSQEAAKEAEGTEETEEPRESEEPDPEDASEQAEDEQKEKGGFFRKKEKKDKRDEQIAELNDRVKRQMAEFDNFRKRSEKEKNQMYEIGAKSIIEKLLPVIDNFERGLATVPEEEKGSGFAEGMDKIYRQMTAMLEEAGVTIIEAVGKEFDPNLHNAVMHVEDDTLGENVIAEEFQKGYMYRDSVVRHSMVKVAN